MTTVQMHPYCKFPNYCAHEFEADGLLFVRGSEEAIASLDDNKLGGVLFRSVPVSGNAASNPFFSHGV